MPPGLVGDFRSPAHLVHSVQSVGNLENLVRNLRVIGGTGRVSDLRRRNVGPFKLGVVRRALQGILFPLLKFSLGLPLADAIVKNAIRRLFVTPLYGGMVISAMLTGFFLRYACVRTIASSFSDALSFSLSRCFRFRLVAPAGVFKSIREGFTSPQPSLSDVRDGIQDALAERTGHVAGIGCGFSRHNVSPLFDDPLHHAALEQEFSESAVIASSCPFV